MDNPLDAFWGIRLNAVAEALKKNGFAVVVVDSPEAAREYVLTRLVAEAGAKEVAHGGSMSVRGAGLYDALDATAGLTVHNPYKPGLSPEESMAERRAAFNADLFLCSANAVTQDGELVNLDGTGNRVAMLHFGPKAVAVIAGRNKIVPDVDSAFLRVKDIAAPANAVRLSRKTPCAKTGECADCASPERICSVWTITEKCNPKGRITVVLVNAEMGY